MSENRLIIGDCREILPTLAAGSVQCVVTSPPYWNLRSYLPDGHVDKGFEIGSESTLEEYVETLVAVFREVRRVLAPDGTLWLNLGSSYNSGGGTTGGGKHAFPRMANTNNGCNGFKPKDLIPTPWMVAMALQADGWYLRSDIIWSKPNPMPESVRDRCTRSHEYLFLLSKRPTYYFDSYAIREPGSLNSHGGGVVSAERANKVVHGIGAHNGCMNAQPAGPAGRTRRSVWTISTQAFPGAHFATMPEKLIEPAILAGTSERGHCPAPGCGKRWGRVVEREFVPQPDSPTQPKAGLKGLYANGWEGFPRGTTRTKTLAWQPSCSCNLAPVPDVVLDPFAGSNTVGRVAERLGRHWLGIELSSAYGELARRRTEGITQSIFL